MRLQSGVIRFCLCLFLATSGSAIASSAEKSLDFSGTWDLDPESTQTNLTTPELRSIKMSVGTAPPNVEESSPAQTIPQDKIPKVPEEVSLQILQTENEIQAIRRFADRGQERTVIQKFKLDGSQCLNVASNGRGEFTSRSNWKKNKLIHSGSQINFQQEQRVESYVTEEYSLSKNGKKLSIKTTATGPKGVTTTKQTYIRRAQ
jgi:hypothetical protein